ncbi:MAG TPA: hypothetical protein EYN66_07830 [Myxococcales bacterium]|nr:hypothetical protein [Myxococcales bacterium]
MTREERQTLKNDEFDRRLKVAHLAIDAMRTPGVGTVVTFLGIKGLNKVGVVNTPEAVGLQLIASMGTLGQMGPLGVGAVVIATALQGLDVKAILADLTPYSEVTSILKGDLSGEQAMGIVQRLTPQGNIMRFLRPKIKSRFGVNNNGN